MRPENLAFTTWQLLRSKRYGSNHHDETRHPIAGAKLSADGTTLVIALPGLAPTDCYELILKLKSPDGTPIERTLHGTLHRIANRAQAQPLEN